MDSIKEMATVSTKILELYRDIPVYYKWPMKIIISLKYKENLDNDTLNNRL